MFKTRLRYPNSLFTAKHQLCVCTRGAGGYLNITQTYFFACANEETFYARNLALDANVTYINVNLR